MMYQLNILNEAIENNEAFNALSRMAINLSLLHWAFGIATSLFFVALTNWIKPIGFILGLYRLDAFVSGYLKKRLNRKSQ